MRLALCTWALWSMLPAAAASGSDDRLVPPDPDYAAGVRYERALDEILFAGQTARPWMRMVASPAFDPEWAVQIDAPENGQALVTLISTDVQIWGGLWERTRGTRRTARITRRGSTIGEETARLLRRAWVRMLREARPRVEVEDESPSEERWITIDGTVYRFAAFVPGTGLLKGKDYSAPPGSPPYQLGFLGEALRRWVDAPGDRRSWYEEQIAAKARKLLRELESSP